MARARLFSKNECIMASVTMPMASDRMLPIVCTLYFRLLRRATFKLWYIMFIYILIKIQTLQYLQFRYIR